MDLQEWWEGRTGKEAGGTDRGTDVLGGHQGRPGSCEAGAVRGGDTDCSRGGRDTGQGWRAEVEQQPYLHPLLSSRVTGVGRWVSLQRQCSPVAPPPLKLLQLIAKSQLTSLSGVAQKNYFNILDKIVQKGKASTGVFTDLSLS